MNNGDKLAFESTTTEYRNSGGQLMGVVSDGGLTKREYFAGLAMQGLMANGNIKTTISGSDIAETCVAAANALLKALEAKDENNS